MALAERTRAARDVCWAAKGCGLPRAVWEPLTGLSSRRVLDLVAQQCASSGAAPGRTAAAAAAWERYRRTFPPFVGGAHGAVRNAVRWLHANRARSLGNMVASMPKRVAMCLERKGAMTEY